MKILVTFALMLSSSTCNLSLDGIVLLGVWHRWPVVVSLRHTELCLSSCRSLRGLPGIPGQSLLEWCDSLFHCQAAPYSIPYIGGHISRQMPIHAETMKLALLVLMLSACLLDFVSARGVASVGKAPTYYVRKHNIIVFSSLSSLFQDAPQYDHDPDQWYWTNR